MFKIIFIICSFIYSFSQEIDFKSLNIDEPNYVIKCIENYKFIQFIEKRSGRGGDYYVKVGIPQQLFQSIFDKNNIPQSSPIPCN